MLTPAQVRKVVSNFYTDKFSVSTVKKATKPTLKIKLTNATVTDYASLRNSLELEGLTVIMDGLSLLIDVETSTLKTEVPVKKSSSKKENKPEVKRTRLAKGVFLINL